MREKRRQGTPNLIHKHSLSCVKRTNSGRCAAWTRLRRFLIITAEMETLKKCLEEKIRSPK